MSDNGKMKMDKLAKNNLNNSTKKTKDREEGSFITNQG
jgi:hypothetical protein